MDRAINPRTARANKQIIIIVCIYIILTVSNRFSAKNNESDESLIRKIQSQSKIQATKLIQQISKEKLQGQWSQSGEMDSLELSKTKGKFEMMIAIYSQSSEQRFSIDVKIKNGDYIDDGFIEFRVAELQTNWNTEQGTNKITAKFTQNQGENKIKIGYLEELIFQTVKRGQFNLTNIELEYAVVQDALVKTLTLSTEKQKIAFTLQKARYNLSGTILFALILFVIAYSEFSACLDIIKKFIEGEENPINYSFFTLVMTMMWDAALCLTAFIEAFKNQENIVLFIVPAFILCLLFTNLELRIMIIVFQAISGENDIRHVICRFNIISYGAILAMYPIIILTNAGTPLFLLFSVIYLPQIYTNAVTGRRPNPNSMYYNEFLLFRFMIVLYLKCFPYNIFELRPNYPLGFGCLLIVGCQFGLLWVQKIYGPKKVLPRFMLPAVFDYNCEEPSVGVGSENLQVIHQQCSICLQVLKKNPQIPSIEYEVLPKIMKTPCGHKYHGICLAQWMRLKMQCPQCRTKLPPFE